MPVSDVEPRAPSALPSDGDGLIALMEQQALADGISPTQLARDCGIDPGFWSRARRGIERLGPTAVAGVVRRYPELRPAAIQYLVEGGRLLSPETLHLLEEAAQLACEDPAPDR